jgi:hypothetical protein
VTKGVKHKPEALIHPTLFPSWYLSRGGPRWDSSP